jgi:hypothetical protein
MRLFALVSWLLPGIHMHSAALHHPRHSADSILKYPSTVTFESKVLNWTLRSVWAGGGGRDPVARGAPHFFDTRWQGPATSCRHMFALVLLQVMQVRSAAQACERHSHSSTGRVLMLCTGPRVCTRIQDLARRVSSRPHPPKRHRRPISSLLFCCHTRPYQCAAYRGPVRLGKGAFPAPLVASVDLLGPLLSRWSILFIHSRTTSACAHQDLRPRDELWVEESDGPLEDSRSGVACLGGGQSGRPVRPHKQEDKRPRTNPRNVTSHGIAGW